MALTKKINMLNVWVKVVTLNKPPKIPIPLSKGLINRLLKAKELAKTRPFITSLENKIDLSRLRVKAFESKRFISKVINNFVAFFSMYNYNIFNTQIKICQTDLCSLVNRELYLFPPYPSSVSGKEESNVL